MLVQTFRPRGPMTVTSADLDLRRGPTRVTFPPTPVSPRRTYGLQVWTIDGLLRCELVEQGPIKLSRRSRRRSRKRPLIFREIARAYPVGPADGALFGGPAPGWAG